MIHAMLGRMNSYQGFKILSVLWMILKQKKGPRKKKSKWSLYLNEGETPRQKNTYDWSVFICLFCYLISKHQPVKFDQSIIPSFWSHMAISIFECKTYEINHLRRQDTLKKNHQIFILKWFHANQTIMMSSLQSWSINYDMRLLNCWETAISDNSNSIIINDKTLSFFQLQSVLLLGFTLVAAMLMMIIAWFLTW